jgi:hypothetical protein
VRASFRGRVPAWPRRAPPERSPLCASDELRARRASPSGSDARAKRPERRSRPPPPFAGGVVRAVGSTGARRAAARAGLQDRTRAAHESHTPHRVILTCVEIRTTRC